MRPNATLEQASVYRRWKQAWIIEESIVSMAFMRVVVIARRLVGLPAFSPPAVSCLTACSTSYQRQQVLPSTWTVIVSHPVPLPSAARRPPHDCLRPEPDHHRRLQLPSERPSLHHNRPTRPRVSQSARHSSP